MKGQLERDKRGKNERGEKRGEKAKSQKWGVWIVVFVRRGGEDCLVWERIRNHTE